MNDLRPMVFDPILVPKPWGGRRLERFGKALPAEGTFGESWEIADLQPAAVSSSVQCRTRARDGEATLAALIERWGGDLLGSASPTPEGDFPLLVKWLDARENLSVQVHPTADYVASHPGTSLKTESWYVVDAEAGAQLFIGFRGGVTRSDVETAAGLRAVVDLLQPIPARPGDFHHLPAGIIHALGAGVMVAEPQTPSDTTFRLYDWADEYGREPRDLHVAEGVATVELRPKGAVSLAAMETSGNRVLVETEHYWVREHREEPPPATEPELRILQVVAGSARVSFSGSELPLPLGTTALVPAACAPATSVSCSPGSTLLEIGLVQSTVGTG